MSEEKKIPLEALSDEALGAVTGGDAIAHPCHQCGLVAWVYDHSYQRPFHGQPGGPDYGKIYVCGNCKKLYKQGLVDNVPSVDD